MVPGFGTVRSVVGEKRAVSPPERDTRREDLESRGVFVLSSDSRRALAMAAGITEAKSLRRKR